VILKDLKPSNIRVDAATGLAHGFWNSLTSSARTAVARVPEFIAGTLPYVASEQTGGTSAGSARLLYLISHGEESAVAHGPSLS
jgi:hypothetical protein